MSAADTLVETLARLLDVPEVWVRAAGVAVAGVLLAFVFHYAVHRILLPVARRTTADADDVFLENVDAPGAWTIAFLGVVGGARLVWPGAAYEPTFRQIYITGILVIWGAALARALTVVLKRGTRRLYGASQQSAINLVARLMKVAVAVVIVLTVLSVWNVSITPVLASAGLVGIALALAAQDSLSNFFSGVAIYLDQPYQIGDWVVLDAGSELEVRGIVRDVGLRSTRILTRDDVLVTVPNSVIANARITNESGAVAHYRVAVPVSVAYASDMEHVERVLVRVADAHPKVLGDPPARARLRAFAESGIEWDLLVWIRNPGDRGPLVHDLAKAVHAAFRDEGITIPFPQRDVHLAPGEGPRP